MRAKLAALRAKIREALDRVATVRDLMKATLPLWASVVLACGAAVFGLWWQAQEREDDLRDARVSACVRDNAEQQGDRDSTLNLLLVAFGFTAAGDMTANDRELIVAGLTPDLQIRYRDVEAQTALDNPFRDCSPAGIASASANPPADPATETTIPPQPSTGGTAS